MNRELGSLIREWHTVLLDTVAAYSTVSNSVSDRAAQRTGSLRNAASVWARRGIVQPFDYTLPERDDADAVGRVRRAVKDMSRLMARITDYLADWPVDGVQEKRIYTNLSQRRRNLEGLLTEMENEAWRSFYVQMNETVPTPYSCSLLGEEWQRYPHASPNEALCIMKLHRARVPVDYASSLLPRASLSLETADTVIRLYTEGIPIELGAALV